ncbi:hypothetical protein PCANC_02355 [Puccinia coronata f. sp. avenae]|uniref:Uncharacterized protein n=1 Tax=Puccinia coronata f. sp. avenae TaxID=200324 RepID=A0A2N5S3J3_9BASI|nr:hypothetical protein PCANC_21055 [Puccinia coronata f. sp. avenae]PLW55334.1 hypothetical protein PCANC_02355 [Puccinia coronata f. sp. avenae]
MSNSSAHHVRLLVTVTLRYFPVVINSAHHAGLGQLESESRTDIEVPLVRKSGESSYHLARKESTGYISSLKQSPRISIAL